MRKAVFGFREKMGEHNDEGRSASQPIQLDDTFSQALPALLRIYLHALVKILLFLP
jgi:hypothetical protein